MAKEVESGNGYQCFHCGQDSVFWDSDFNAEEYGYEKDYGIVHICHCINCNAQITYFVPNQSEDFDDGKDEEEQESE